MNLHLRTVLALAGALLVLARPASAQERVLTERVDRVIDQALADKRIVGAVVLVAQDGKVIYRRAAGLADREAKRPMKEDTVFRLASMSKPIVSVAALRLIDQGILRLDDPVTKWLPAFKPRLADGREPVITIRQLLTHTSGLSYPFHEKEDGPYHRAKVSTGLDQPGLSLEENLRRLSSVPLAFETGTQWRYSMSIDVLGAVVAKAAGAPLPQAVERLVTGPIGMPDTHFVAKGPARLATPYADGVPEPVRMGESHSIPYGPSAARFSPGRALDARSFPSGGAGMVGTAGDFLKFLEALRTGGTPVLKSQTVSQATASQTGTLPNAPGGGWGFGYISSVLVNPAEAKSPQSVGTYQWGGAYGHTWFVDPQRRLSVVMLTNTAFEGMSGAFPSAIRDALYETTASNAPSPAVRLYALDCGRIEISDMGMFSDTGEHAGEKGDLANPCFLIRHPKGDLLWDTGIEDRLAALPNGEPIAGGHAWMRTSLKAQLAQLGLKPTDIEYVSASHLHVDHVGNAEAFTGATWLLNPAELAWGQGKPTPLGVEAQHVNALKKVKVIPTNMDHDVFGDGSVRILRALGHTPGHQILMVRLVRSGAVILSGDLFHSRENYEKSLVPPFNASRAETLASMDRVARLIRATGARLVVQHDGNDFKALPTFPAWLD